MKISVEYLTFLEETGLYTIIIKEIIYAVAINISNPKLLVMAIMVITSLVAWVFSAGLVAAAMMPVIVEICKDPLSA